MRAIQLAILTLLLCVVPGAAYAWQDTETTAGAGQGGDVKTERLAWRLQEGQEFNVTLSKTAQITTKVDTRLRKVDAETTMELEWEVVSSNDARVMIRQTLNRIKLTSGAPGDVSARRLDYDSAVKVYRSGLSGKVSKQYQNSIGLISTFALAPDGQVSDFLNEAGQEKMTDNLPDGSAVKEMLSGQSAAIEISKLTNLSWQSKSDSAVVKRPVKSELGDFVSVDRYRVKESKDGQIIVEVETTAQGIDGDSPAAKVDRYQGQGSIVFNDENGFVSYRTVEMTVASKTAYRDMKIESLTEVQTTMTLNQKQ